MSKRNRRDHGRILSVDTLVRGGTFAADFAAGVTSITVDDAGDFDEDGGWLVVGAIIVDNEWDYTSAQVIEFTACDDDEGIITLAEPLTAAAEQGDPVHLWSPTYAEAIEYQQALVQLDGEYDNPDPVVAEVAEGVEALPEGDRGEAGESCTLHQIADDEWEIIAVGGRSKRSRDLKFEADDAHVLTAENVTAGSASFALTYRPINESLTAYWAGTFQPPTEYSIDYAQRLVTWPLGGFEQAGDRLWVHYAYRKGIVTPEAFEEEPPGATCANGTPEKVEWYRSSYPYIKTTISFLAGANIGSDWKVYLVTDRGAGPVWAQDKNQAINSAGEIYVGNFSNQAVVVGFGFFIRNLANETAGNDKWKHLPPAGGAPNPNDYFMGVNDPSRCRFYFGTKIADIPADNTDEPGGPATQVSAP